MAQKYKGRSFCRYLRSMVLHRYFMKTPWLVKKIFPHYTWNMPAAEKKIYLTFDDGPHPEITPFVLEQLKQYNAAATFFCIGENVVNYPETIRSIVEKKHSIGNHTYHHLNGWKTGVAHYLEDVAKAATVINSGLFRPPYGRIKNSQATGIATAMNRKDARIIMWDVLSGDFDKQLLHQQCLQHVLKNTANGSIIVFHDSEKAFPHLKKVLPEVLKVFNERGYVFEKL